MHINTHLNFDGQCDEAFQYYAKVLGGEVKFKMTWGESPMAKELPADAQNLIMHASLKIGDGDIMGADSPPGRYTKPTGMNVSVHVKETAEGERIFNALADGGEEQMPFQKTFWSGGFGMCVDRYGIPWMVNTEQGP